MKGGPVRGFHLFAVLLCLFTGLNPLPAAAGMGGDAPVNEGPLLYIEWPGMDWNHVRREIAFVNYVRQRNAAEIVLLVTTQTAGNGATVYTLTWTGHGQFAGLNETLTHTTVPGSSEVVVRRDLITMMKIALVRYLARTPLATRLTIGLDPAGRRASGEGRTRDPWDAWVFKIYGSAYLSGEKSSTYQSLYSSLAANRVTADWKLSLFGSLGRVRSTWFTDPDWVVSENRSWYAGVLSVWSLDQHWSAGALANATFSTYQNLDLAAVGALALEYNIFPYARAARRQWRFLYNLGLKHHDYHVLTLYDKMEEWLPYQSLAASLVVKEPWGNLILTLSGSNYLNDFSKNRIGAYLEFTLKMVAGLSLDVYASGTRLRDQLALPAGAATEEEILLRRRELATGYSYWISVGISYTFGSIYNNVVNPRFGT